MKWICLGILIIFMSFVGIFVYFVYYPRQINVLSQFHDTCYSKGGSGFIEDPYRMVKCLTIDI